MFFVTCIFAVFLEDQSDPANKSFFSEIISSISDVKFSHDGNYFFARDYLTIKVRMHCWLTPSDVALFHKRSPDVMKINFATWLLYVRRFGTYGWKPDPQKRLRCTIT